VSLSCINARRTLTRPPASGYDTDVQATENQVTGDFIHVKPEGFARLGQDVGDTVLADGDAHFLSTGGGWAVEATKVNRRAVR